MTLKPSAAACPCCRSEQTKAVANGAWYRCSICQHRWRTSQALSQPLYWQQQGRNLPGNPYLKRKNEDRLEAVLKLVGEQAHILEVGCAEGQLGQAVKNARDVIYEAAELSKDHEAAAACLDRVYRTTTAEIEGNGNYQLILAFHVLEHIEDIEEEIAQWLRLLHAEGSLLIEVPNRSGHPDLANDAHPEHLHQFALSSLVALLSRLNVDVREATSGHFESPAYSDSIRVVAKRLLTDQEKQRHLITRFEQALGQPFRVYGIGGDFRNYVLPILSELKIIGLIDSAPESVTAPPGFQVDRFDVARHGDAPILISSLRFKNEIARSLEAQGMPSNLIVGLDDVFGAP